ncbi:MAG TPA: aminoglycoside 3'-phosphotransferase [Acidimicrobiales bacterium]
MTAAPTDLRLAPEVTELLEGGTWTAVTSGAWSRVWRVDLADGVRRVAVKVALAQSSEGVAAGADPGALLTREAQCLAWVAGPAARAGVPVPEVVLGPHLALGVDPALVTSFLDGEADLRLLGTSARATEALGRTLAQLHTIDPAGCPFDASPAALLAEVGGRVDAGLVTSDEFQPALQSFAPERLLTHVRAMAPATVPEADQVLVHGDFCVTNLLVDPASTKATGVLDWGRCGAGDRHLDLAVTARSVVRNFGGEALPGFFGAYGESHPDPLRLEFYALLDEFS